ncbi:hypothetical protein BAY61_30695 [Prauserella marina]|uniref:Uncharacterized protein n=1 Tax=Prauserella marina TaxID=530584 RepID=A0A222VXF0_9PSEU|nr:ankyrin repeat domain-containing protein [Prauserella marina]ASR38646.1 hypothetical protein BAY61_30695 [Prauserella marina]PWV81974.1 hypothetical protein DES30_102208 [Prauserella marina]SDD16516.1 hypothetical protein SAMN05421630_106208 [Prauserella marina]
MQAVFQDIVKGDEASVRSRIENNPSLVDAVASGSPKKYVGQSALQVAIRTGRFGIARFLLEKGSDPRFVDVKSPTGWSRSVFHDAAVAAVMRSRWSRRTFNAASEQVWLIAETAKSDEAFEMLVALIEAGADATAVDSLGATPLGRAVLAAHDVLPRRNDEKPELSDGKPLTPELVDDLTRIFELLKTHGADPEQVEPQLEKSLANRYRHELVGKFLKGGVEPDSAA